MSIIFDAIPSPFSSPNIGWNAGVLSDNFGLAFIEPLLILGSFGRTSVLTVSGILYVPSAFFVQ
nr:MAG TPA_asm: hypothetical protein [Bacteriophage sp.]